MQQIHLFEPTFQQRLEEFLGDPILDYFITRSLLIGENRYLRHCKVLTKKHVYDVTISESYDYDSEVNHKADRNEFGKNFLARYFEKYKKLFGSNFVD